MEITNNDVVTVKIYDSNNEIREAQVFYTFKYGGKGYCVAATLDDPVENQIFGYGYDEDGKFFNYDIAEPLYRRILDEYTSKHLPKILEKEDDIAPVINVQGIGNECNITKKAQALMFFKYGINEEKKHDYVLTIYIEPDRRTNRGAFYRYEFLKDEDNQNIIATEPIRNDMEYEAVRNYFRMNKGKELEQILRKEHIKIDY